MTQTPAGFQATTSETSRVLTRGLLEFFHYGFFYDDAKLQPIVPLDTQNYPSFRILSPSGEVLAQGVAVLGGGPGYWKIGWVVPKAAELTTVHKRYKFQSVMVDKEGRQYEVSFEFDVTEAQTPAQNPEPQQLITFVGSGIRVSFKNTRRPKSLALRITPRESDSTILASASLPPFPFPDPPGPTSLREVEDGTGYAYYFDVPAFGVAGDYSALWIVQDTDLSTTDFEHQSIQVVTTSMMFLVKSLRMLMDKLQKKLGLVYAYTNEDLFEYLRNGTQLINAYWPTTLVVDIASYPKPLEAFIILASAWWGLTAQRLLYAETNFSFSGQTVTLDYNPGADIDGVLSTIKETLDSRVSATKKDLSRHASGVGSIATRPYRYRSSLVFPVSAGYGRDMLNMMITLGILD